MEEFHATELQNQAHEIDSATAVRCAKVSRLLSDLQLSAADEDESVKKVVTSELKRQLTKLERQVLKERQNSKRMRFDRVMEICVWIGIFFCLWNICLFLFFDFSNLS